MQYYTARDKIFDILCGFRLNLPQEGQGWTLNARELYFISSTKHSIQSETKSNSQKTKSFKTYIYVEIIAWIILATGVFHSRIAVIPHAHLNHILDLRSWLFS